MMPRPNTLLVSTVRTTMTAVDAAEGDALRNALPSLDEILDAGGSLDDAYRTFARKARSSRAGRPPRW